MSPLQGQGKAVLQAADSHAVDPKPPSGSRFYWGFENYRTLVLNSQHFDCDPEIVSTFTLGIIDEAIRELERMGVEHFPDVVPDWEYAPSLEGVDLAIGPSTSKPTLDRAAEDDQDDEDL